VMEEAYFIIMGGLAAVSLLSGVIWRVYNKLDDADDAIHTKIDGHVKNRENLFESMRTTVEARYNDVMRRLAEVGERLTSEKIERMRDMQGFVTKFEFDKRLERVENNQHVQNTKLDEILKHVINSGR
jgi:uncharacterized protein YqgV (UPF0045/DUF77 family)